jgi:hypothetical protein
MVLSISLPSSISLSMLSLVWCSIHLTLCIFLQHHISKLSSVRCSALYRIHVSHPYSATLHTDILMKRFLTLILMLLEHNKFFLFINTDFTSVILDLISMTHLPSWLIKLPRYLKCSYNIYI